VLRQRIFFLACHEIIVDAPPFCGHSPNPTVAVESETKRNISEMIGVIHPIIQKLSFFVNPQFASTMIKSHHPGTQEFRML
jgi:hypothetical protein